MSCRQWRAESGADEAGTRAFTNKYKWAFILEVDIQSKNVVLTDNYGGTQIEELTPSIHANQGVDPRLPQASARHAPA